MSLAEFLRAAPKAELHVHLEGSIRPATLLALARRHGVALPAADVDGLRRWFRYRDFQHFITVYVAITRCLRERADYELITLELARSLAAQNARYAEVTFSPSTHRWLGVPEAAWREGLAAGRERAWSEHGVRLQWVFDIVRNGRDVPASADYTTRVAIDARAEGVVALGLGGMEQGHPPEPFARWFERAKAAGLAAVPHAGETVGPESVRGALAALHADRIGHGVRAVEDPELVAELAERGVPLEVCPTSNVRLGVYADLAQHPLPALLAAGVTLTVNSDDPPLFNTTLADEAALLAEPFGLDESAAAAVLLNGVRCSLLPADEKAALLADYRAELARLRAQRDGPAGAAAPAGPSG